MGTQALLKSGVESLTLTELFRKASKKKGLEFCEGVHQPQTRPFKTYQLNSALLAYLTKRGITNHGRPDCNYETFTLVDDNPQLLSPGYVPSNYWNFKEVEGKKGVFDLRISLYFELHLGTEERGIIFMPMASGTFVSAGSHLPNFRMFKALVEQDTSAPGVAREVAKSQGHIVLPWTQLGLGGIRSLRSLFDEFAKGRQSVIDLGTDSRVLNPTPFSRYQNQKSGDEVFITEPAQPKLFESWRTQMKAYRAALVA